MDLLIRDQSRVVLFPLLIRPERGEYVVGREEIDRYVLLPEVGVKAVRALQDGISVGEVKARLAREYGEEVEMEPFLEELAAEGFIRSIDGRLLGPEPVSKGSRAGGFAGRLARGLFSRPAGVIVALLSLSALALAVRSPELLPRAEDFFFLESRAAVLFSAFVLGWTLASAHELAHWLSARAFGLTSRVRIGNRLSYLILESEISNVWNLPRAKRSLIYLSGMLWEIVSASALILLFALYSRGHLPLSPFVLGLLRLSALLLIINFFWQFRLFMKTDVYYLVADLLARPTLYEDTMRYLAGPFSKSRVLLSKNEERTAKLYAWVLVLGTLLTLIPFFLFLVPITVRLLTETFLTLIGGLPAAGLPRYLDAAVVLGINVFYFGLLGYSVYRKFPYRAIRFACLLVIPALLITAVPDFSRAEELQAISFTVAGMGCNPRKVESALLRTPGVKSAEVRLGRRSWWQFWEKREGRITIDYDAERILPAELARVIEESGAGGHRLRVR